MEDGIMMSIARIGVQVGMHLTGQHPGASGPIDRTALANAIVHSAALQASEIVAKLGIIDHIDVERGEFGLIVGVIARQMFSLTELLANLQLSTADCSLDVGDACIQAYMAMRKRGAREN